VGHERAVRDRPARQPVEARRIRPRLPEPRTIMTDHPMRLSGLEPFNIGESTLFVNVGERTNVTGSKAFARMILNSQFDEALAVA
ncbi:hypothetical protein, partial [Enterobacter hormaechei]|uniref:hypothetical protein n=1 Tax=Enterobacter hormaechei TaxID=158836 RepID=UPI003F688EBE